MDKTIAFTILGLIGFAFLTQNSKENFVGGLPNFTTKVINSGYTIPSKIPPRFANFDGPAHVRYSGVPMQYVHNSGALGRGDIDGVLYRGPGGKAGSQPQGSNPIDDRTLDMGPLAQGYPVTEGFKGDIMTTNWRAPVPEVSDVMPTSGNSEKLTNPQGEPIIYDRIIFANQRSRLYEQGDPIRGDLPIIPHQNDWMRPSVRPNIDLRDGAMAVMGGWDNMTSKQTLELRNASSGGFAPTQGGIDYVVEKRQALNSHRDLIM